MAKKNEKPSIEDSLSNLESILKKMESNEGTLKENLDWYEECIGRVNECQAELKVEEQKVFNLVKNSKNEFDKKKVK